jgi:hypothetical protein
MNEQELNFALSIEEANLILNSLMELPAKASMGLIQKLQQQAAGQLSAPEPDVEAVED